MLPVMILAGGLATRLRPLTETIPKALIEIAGKSFITYQLQYLKNQGISSVVLCVGYLGEMIQSQLGDGSQFGLSIQYSFDGPVLLGTGGAVKKALPMISDDFFILYGDSFLPINFLNVQKAYAMSKQPALMTVLKNNNRWDRSNVVFKNSTLIVYDKNNLKPEMEYIDYGLGIVNSEIFTSLTENSSFDICNVYNKLSIENKLYGYEVFERFYEIGSPQGILETEKYLLLKGLL
jgi:NDP-sugar pyrophosphorylase family protein